ncbi:SDR family oxidoreductase [Lentzea sp. NBRC 105346]|uniref:SDR family NAD(P)-dependent oxidoreductase n=1 Tax=Lentzea sp. NBRC 105346 TaxID=3032205 RepID=UPI0025574172|nr:SDR family oxidoreductase [Lentzea sp. NBRC 105346]
MTAAVRTALVTGASRGIGRAVAERLGRNGFVVAVHFREDAAAAKETMSAVEAAGGQAFPIQAELGVPGDIDTLFAGLTAGLAEYGGKLNVLVNNAGIGCKGGVDEITPEQFDRVFAVNVKAPVFLVQRVLPLMPEGGRIVNVSSLASRAAHPQIVGYAMSKGALDVFGRSIAAQLGARGITVNTVAPGLIDTDFHGDRFARPEVLAEAEALSVFGRLGQAGDVADVVAFLASDEARWLTGERIETAGGTRL